MAGTRVLAKMLPRIDAGQIVADRYELARPIGRGSMGEVWIARHRTLGEDVALKLLSPALSGTEIEESSTAIARFRFEAQVAARLSRKTRHIVRVTDNGEENGLAYLVMELLEGETLAARLLRSGPVDKVMASQLVAQMARALTEAHGAGVMHRDLKPANVFLTRDEEGGLLVKLLDFGIARTVPSHRVTPAFATAPGLIFGTPGYMSPEQAFFASELDHRCDLWALATIAYEALTGDLPLAGTNTQELLASLCAGRIVSVHERNPGLPGPLSGFFGRVFAKNLADRFPTASELSRAFDRAIRIDGNARVDSPPAAADPLKGTTVSMTLPMRGRRRLDDAKPPAQAARRARPRLFVLAIALLIGLAALGTAWRARALRTPRASGASSGAAVAGASPVEEATGPPSAPLPDGPAAGPGLPAPIPEGAMASTRVEPPLAALRTSPTQRPMPALPRAPASPTAPAGATQCSSSCPSSPSSTPVPTASASARAPVDRSGVL